MDGLGSDIRLLPQGPETRAGCSCQREEGIHCSPPLFSTHSTTHFFGQVLQMIVWSARLLTSVLFWLRWRSPKNDYFELYDSSSQLARIYFSTVTTIEVIVSVHLYQTWEPNATSLLGSNIFILLPSTQTPSHCPPNRHSHASFHSISFHYTPSIKLRKSRCYTSAITTATQSSPPNHLRTRPSRLSFTFLQTSHNSKESRFRPTISFVQSTETRS